MIQAVIFDMDGLIIDSEGYESISYVQVLKEEGVEPVLNELGIVHTVGINMSENWKKLRKKYSLQPSVEELVRRKRAAYDHVLDEGIPAMEGFFELLAMLKTKSVKIAVASSSPIKNINKVLDHLGVKQDFDAIVSGEEAERGKPAPDIFIETAKKLEVNPARCIVLEDAQSGIFAAKAAGMKIIAVPNHYTKNHDFGGADLIVPSLKSINLKELAKL